MSDVITGTATKAVERLMQENAKYNKLMLDGAPTLTIDLIAEHCKTTSDTIKGDELLPHCAVTHRCVPGELREHLPQTDNSEPSRLNPVKVGGRCNA